MTHMSQIQGPDFQMVDAIGFAVEASLAKIRTHPFIKGAMQKSLTKEEAVRWVLCAGRESQSFPEILKGMLSNSPEGYIREVLVENLNDELGNGNPEHAHFKHYVVLLEQLGLGKDAFDSYVEGPGIRLALDLAYAMAQSNKPCVALGYMLVNEGMTQITYEAARSALGKHFNLTDETFFNLHVEVDEEHVAMLYDGLASMPDLAIRDVIYGVELGERGMAMLLDEAFGTFD